MIGGTWLDVPMGSFADTDAWTPGNSELFLPPAVFTTVTSSVLSSTGLRIAAFGGDAGGPDAGAPFFSEMTNCATTAMTKAELDASLPPLTLVFGTSPAISVDAVATESYLISVGDGQWCPGLLSLAPTADYPFVASLGAPILRSNVIVFNRANSRIGFAPHAPCN